MLFVLSLVGFLVGACSKQLEVVRGVDRVRLDVSRSKQLEVARGGDNGVRLDVSRASAFLSSNGLSLIVNAAFTAGCESAIGMSLEPMKVPLTGGISITLHPTVGNINGVMTSSILDCNGLSTCVEPKLRCANGAPELCVETASSIVVTAKYTIDGPFGFAGTCKIIFHTTLSTIVTIHVIDGHAIPQTNNITADVEEGSTSLTCDGAAAQFIKSIAALFPKHIAAGLKTIVEKETQLALDSWASTAGMSFYDNKIQLGKNMSFYGDASVVEPVGCLRDLQSGAAIAVVVQLDGGVVFTHDGLPPTGIATPPPITSLPPATSFDAALILSDSSLSSGGYALYRSGKLSKPFLSTLIPGWPADLNATTLATLLGAPTLPPAYKGRAVKLIIGVYAPPVITSTTDGIKLSLPLSLDVRLKHGRPNPLLLRVQCQVTALMVPRAEPRQGCGPIDIGAALDAPLRIAFMMSVVEGCRAELLSNIGPVKSQKALTGAFEAIVDLVLLPAAVLAVDTHQGIIMCGLGGMAKMAKSIDIVTLPNAFVILLNFTECPTI